MNADENEAVVDASGLEVDAARRGVAAVPASAPARSSCSRCRTCTARPGSSSPACACVGSRAVALARLDPRRRDRAVALRGRLRAARRADRRAAARRRARLPLRRRRRPLRRAGHDRADRAPVDRAARPRARRRARLPPDGRQSGAPLPADREGGRRQRHLPLRGRATTCRDDRGAAREHGLGVGVAFNPGREPRGRRAGVAAGATSCSA